MNYEIKKWNKEKFGEMTFENICRVYSSNKNLTLPDSPPFLRSINVKNKNGNYCVRWNRYEFGAYFGGEKTDSDYYVLKGNCEIKIGDEIIRLRADDYFEFPKGNYNFQVIGDEWFEYVAAYKIPVGLQHK